MLKDQRNKKAHEDSAQLACEAAGAIRTVASLTREQDCCDIYSRSLEEPLRISNRTALWSNLVYALSQSMMFYVIALVFWYGSRLVSIQEVSTFHFFIALMVSGCISLYLVVIAHTYIFSEFYLQRFASWKCVFLRARCFQCSWSCGGDR